MVLGTSDDYCNDERSRPMNSAGEGAWVPFSGDGSNAWLDLNDDCRKHHREGDRPDWGDITAEAHEHKLGNILCTFGGPTCIECKAGTFVEAEGSTECAHCPAGKSSDFEGSSSIDDCAPCPAGTAALAAPVSNCWARAYEGAGCDCHPESMCESESDPCCGDDSGYCHEVYRGSSPDEWINTCHGIDFLRLPEGCSVEVATESGGGGERYSFDSSVLVCGYECESRETPGE